MEGQTIIGKGRAYRCFRYNIDKYLLMQGININILGETTDESIITELIAQNKAINIGYDYTAVNCPHPDIIMLPTNDGTEKGQYVYLITDNHTLPTSASRKFRDFLLDWLPKNHKDVIDWSD